MPQRQFPQITSSKPEPATISRAACLLNIPANEWRNIHQTSKRHTVAARDRAKHPGYSCATAVRDGKCRGGWACPAEIHIEDIVAGCALEGQRRASSIHDGEDGEIGKRWLRQVMTAWRRLRSLGSAERRCDQGRGIRHRRQSSPERCSPEATRCNRSGRNCQIIQPPFAHAPHGKRHPAIAPRYTCASRDRASA